MPGSVMIVACYIKESHMNMTNMPVMDSAV
jgi:hypothetical protein